MELKRSVDKPSMTKLSNLSSEPKKKQGILTDKDLLELMGQNRQTYKRDKGGAVKRK